jgi:hypothetical protein
MTFVGDRKRIAVARCDQFRELLISDPAQRPIEPTREAPPFTGLRTRFGDYLHAQGIGTSDAPWSGPTTAANPCFSAVRIAAWPNRCVIAVNITNSPTLTTLV